MDNDNKDTTERQEEDEYQYADSDSVETYVEPEPLPVSKSSSNNDKRKRMLLLCAVLFLFFIVFQFLNAKNKPAKTNEPKPVPAIQKTTLTKPGLTPFSVPPAAPVMAEPAVDALTLLKETKTDEAVQALQTSLLGLETKLTQLADTVHLLGLQVETLAKKNKPIRVLRPKIKRYVVKPRLIKAVKEPIYYIKAIVPRRAWLQAEDGKALTVKVGDTLAGYGLIQAINSSEGTVATSSNKIINFDSNDN